MKNSIILLAFIGDLMLGRGVNDLISTYPPESFWGTTLPILRSADSVFANLECAITTNPQPWTETFKVFHFRANPEAVTILKAGKINVVSLANNHTLDFGIKGLMDTTVYLNGAGIHYAGAGKNLAEARAPVMVTVKGLKIAFLSATDNEPPFAAQEDKPGTNYLDINTEPKTLGKLKEDIEKAKAAGAEFVILSLHWGPNMVQTPTKTFQDFAHKAIDIGIDVIFGHSAHLFQGVEFYQKGVILYNTGDFLDDYAVDPDLHNDWSFIFLLQLDGKAIQRVKAVPVKLNYGQTNLAKDPEASAMISRLKFFSDAFGTQSDRVGDALELFPKE